MMNPKRKFKRKILALLLGNNTGATLRQQLLDGAPFRSSLLYTAVPQFAAPGTTGTFTRATTSTWPNNDGYLVTGVAGEIGFVGARRVDNLIRLGAAQSSTLAVAANVTMTLPAGAYQFSMGAGTGTATFSGTGGAAGMLDASASGRVFVAKTITAGTLIVTGSVATLNDIQVVSMVAETDQTTIREYVSVGVESAPYYHGSFADGVLCSPNDLSGNPLTGILGYQAQGPATNSCLQGNNFSVTWSDLGTPAATQNAVGPNGQANYAWTLTDNAAGAFEGKSQTLIAWAAGVVGCAQILVGKKSSSPVYPIIQLYYNVAASASHRLIVDEVAGTVVAGGTTSPTLYGIRSFNDDFWIVWLAGTQAGATVSARLDIFPSGSLDGSTVSAAAVGSTVFSQAQFVSGASFDSSYIDTAGIAVTRNADVEAYSTSGNIEAAAGSVYLTYTPTHAPNGTIAFWGTYVDASNYTAILHDATNLIFRKRIAGVNYDATIANAFVAGATYKACATWGSSGVTITLDGVEGTPDANTTAVQIAATMQWGADGNSAQQPFASIRNCRAWLRQLSTSERAAVTV